MVQPGVDAKARWVKKGGKSVFGYRQHTLVDNNGLMLALETTAANQHDSKPLLTLLDKAESERTGYSHSCGQSLL
ncbi:MAG: transposase [Nitrosomonas sp.]|uniref:transposase n=1 Tax=Nitrosomonas sp. TaxID=42353 RepID=UPI0025D9C274|nr:transposase [Nitrosomonas sp.]MBY0474373.1 transposase [Nitrosomonas sp.]